MNPYLSRFVRQFMGVVLAALLPVTMTAFLSIPYILGGHPGEPRTLDALADRHMT
jgi:hypothetical protein